MANTLIDPLILAKQVVACAVLNQHAIPRDQRIYRIMIPDVSLLYLDCVVSGYIMPNITNLRAENGRWGVVPNIGAMSIGTASSTVFFGGRDWTVFVKFDNMADGFVIVLCTPNRW